MDKSVDPCQDFYQYACGTWRKNNPIPPDQSRWGRFNELADYNRQFLHNILEKVSANNPKRTDVQQKIGDMYQSCMDETTVNKKGSTPLKPELDGSPPSLPKTNWLTRWLISNLWECRRYSTLAHNLTSTMRAWKSPIVVQGGLGLPDRDYYSDSDVKSQETRQKYLEHMAKMFVLLGDDDATAQKEAQAVMDIETKLADAAFKRVQMRDPKNRDHKMKVSELEALAPTSSSIVSSLPPARRALLKSTWSRRISSRRSTVLLTPYRLPTGKLICAGMQ